MTFDFVLWLDGRLVRRFTAAEAQGIRWAEKCLVRSPYRTCMLDACRGGERQWVLTVSR